VKFNPFRFFRYYLLRFTRLRGDPYSLARGAAVGIFVGVLPLLPVQTILLIPLTLLLRVNTIAAVIAASVVSNPLTFVPQYFYTWKTGNMILPGRISWEELQNTMTTITQEGLLEGISTLSNLSFKTLSVILTGGTIIGIPLAVIGYFVALKFFITLQAKRAAKHKLN
jgi:uncharacterized protein (DUF2062 family)